MHQQLGSAFASAAAAEPLHKDVLRLHRLARQHTQQPLHRLHLAHAPGILKLSGACQGGVKKEFFQIVNVAVNGKYDKRIANITCFLLIWWHSNEPSGCQPFANLMLKSIDAQEI